LGDFLQVGWIISGDARNIAATVDMEIRWASFDTSDTRRWINDSP
jgi:hypothetical protein